MSERKPLSLIGFVLFIFLTLFLLLYLRGNLFEISLPGERTSDQISRPADSSKEQFSLKNESVILSDLTIPWEIAFLPNGGYLITERNGNLVLYKDGEISRIEVDGVLAFGEGGLLGMALDPAFEENQYLYLYYTIETENGIENRVSRFIFNGSSLEEEVIVLEGIPGAGIHNGGRIRFGPDEYLYITTGDAADPSLAQDTNSLAGKILRVGPDGSLPADNPFNNAVYSYGHRNPQGLAWDTEGNLWSTEHGPVANDELNLISVRENYGWPQIVGEETAENMNSPVITSGDEITWAPSGAEYYNGVLYFAGLRGQALYSVNLDSNELTVSKEISETYGRLRFVSVSPEGSLYIGTSNRDGRGLPAQNDDRIIRFTE